MGKYFLVHMFGNIVTGGTEAECKMVLEAFVRYGIRADKFEIQLRKPDGTPFEVYDTEHERCLKEYEYIACSCTSCRSEAIVLEE